ncbi:MAG: hypothetical protein M9928_12710 [Anaerolineae bacterium]|nr:hypothetical protein [Anaerolineae bacterium]MCO5188409.1 hypothetical protein [Anaerolineae bacterium]MCO5194830.1 hypothetical protein [Anaerolineae bacterium]MCO5198438.1 hypothetical protein [Anaerolineae bacterium]MCO5205890.1 hypothetical protein [Anaerolineae bacterium]
MEALIQIHGALAQTVWLFMLVLGVWGLYRAIRGYGVGASYLGALAIGGILIALQGLLGVILWLGSPVRPERFELHVLYGAFAVVFLPFLFAYIKGDDTNRGQWVYAFGTLFLFWMMLRLVDISG